MRIQPVAENLWVIRYPLRLLGIPIGRTVTLVRLLTGQLVIHSTAPFTPDDIAQISVLGQPEWLTDVSCFHDSFAEEGRAAFPHASYLVPRGFPNAGHLATGWLEHFPAVWSEELKVIEIAGMPKVREHVMCHLPSRTLIVADLLFHYGADASRWTKFAARYLLRRKDLAGMSPFFRLMIRDRAAFDRSMDQILSLDFDRIIVAHGDLIEAGGKTLLGKTVR